MVKTACTAAVAGPVLGSGRSPGGGHVNPLQNSCLENPHGQRSREGYSQWGHKKSDMIERIKASTHAEELSSKGVNPTMPKNPQIFFDSLGFFSRRLGTSFSVETLD